MKIPWRCFITATAMLFMAHTVAAVAPTSAAEHMQAAAKPTVSCPGEDFTTFFKKFSNDVNIQRAFTKYPLRIKELDLSAAPEVKKVVKHLRSDQVHFPVFPLKAERERKSIEMHDEKILYQPGKDYLMAYEFVKDDCWYLSSIDNRSFTGGDAKLHWLDNIFPALDDCIPYNFYFDSQSKRTTNGVLERKGYSPYKIEEYVARYKVHEKFMGLDATEIAIPSSTDSVYIITVPVSAQRLAAAIKKRTGHELPIATADFKFRSVVAYLAKEGKNKSSFVCIADYIGGH
ncbi:hypothetical protein LOD50_02395 [Xylella fastidiosa subsp. multiplex]|uniref:Secreted protein n=1 Tax=Xylella fastidiosa subsp. multiplex TaxID=644357 RepID=A0AAW6HTG9_XYLFS|nr:hypothetical protein [Xylella fastidiosa]MDC6407757.1 hypothetical protein [Xylella fastidiosa subsp. multiplex]MDD0935275.1 hypothetical protein [Xylella fastidiosa subsp. multiplex]MSS67820.1 hypothetical protein [Xylella fastidiosa subsp. multiplex]